MSRREPLTAGAIYLILALVFVSPALLPGRTLSAADYLYSAAPWRASVPAGVHGLGANPELVDPSTVFDPIEQYEEAVAPHVPLWNPYIMAGRPMLADAQSAPYSLYTLPAYIVSFWRSLAVSAVLKLLVTAFGMFLFARIALGIGFLGALLSGVVLAFGLFMVAWLPWPLSSVWSFIPWLLLLTDRLVRRPSRLAAAGLAAVVALQYLSGHPESSFHVLAVTAAFGMLRVTQRWRGAGRAAGWRSIGAAVGAIILGTGLAALVLLPIGELVLNSADLTQRAHQAYVTTPARYLFAALLPDYWGRPTQTELSGFLVQRAFYAGALSLLLAGCALAVRRDAERVFFAVLGLLSLAVVVGLQPFTFLIRLIPGFSLAHNTRLVIFYLLGVAVLAGYGLDAVARSRALREPRRRDLVMVGWGTVIVLALAVLGARHELVPRLLGAAVRVAVKIDPMPSASLTDGPATIRMASAIVWVVCAIAAGGLVLLALTRMISPRLFAIVAVSLICADLFYAGMGENPAIPISHARQPATGAIRYLQSRRPARFIGASASGGAIALPPDTAIRYGLYDARGYDLPVEKHYDALWRRTVSDAKLLIPPTQLAPITPSSLRTFDLLGVADILQAPSDPPLRAPGLRLAYRGPDARVYANAGAMPRAALVGAVTVVGSDAAALDAITAPGFDPRRVAIAEQAIPDLPSTPPPPSAENARIVAYASERVVVRVHAARSALLVLSDLAYPGWDATLDGRPVPIWRVDYLLRGVRVPPGSHTIAMRYAPASWRVGWIVSAGSLCVLLALVASGLAARRHRLRTPTIAPVA